MADGIQEQLPSRSQAEQQFLDQLNDGHVAFDVQEQPALSLFEAHPDAVLSFDPAGRCLNYNRALQKMTGYSDEELRHDTMELLIQGADRERMHAHFRRAAAGETLDFESHLLHRDGHRVEVKVKLIPTPARVGEEIAGVYGMFQNITEQNRAAEELRATKELLEAFLYNSADAIWMTDTDQRVLQVNPAFESLFGWSEQEVVGERLPIVPEAFREEMDALYESVKMGNSVIGYETKRIRKDGRFVHASATLSPVRDREGRVIGVSGTCRDISKSKAAEEELRSTKELFESIFHHTTDAVIMFDLTGNVLAMNPASERISAVIQTDGRCQQKQLHQDLIPQPHRHQYLDVLNGRVPFTEYELSRTLPGGRRYDLQVTLSPICNDTGHVSALLLMAKDITESKKTQEMLLQTEKLSIAGQLAAGVAHEIRNPLTALKGFVQLMRFGERYEKRYLDVMATELNRIEMIVSELLVLAKPQSMTFKRKQIEPILQDVVTLSGTQAILHNVQIRMDFAELLPDVDCDENQLKQVFINFIKNAIEAMPQGGELRIEAAVQGEGRMRIRFADQGTGIPEEHLSRLGEPFYTTKTKGTGLGLMVSKKIIENHRGKLEIDSEWGVGTTLDVYLPVPVPDAQKKD